jgi:hypothetical protein
MPFDEIQYPKLFFENIDNNAFTKSCRSLARFLKLDLIDVPGPLPYWMTAEMDSFQSSVRIKANPDKD